MQKAMIACAILAVVGGIFYFNLSGGGGLDLFGTRKDEVQAVTAFKARYAQVAASVSAPGTVTAAQEVQVPSTVNGTVREILVKEGDVVKQGDVLLRLDAREIEAEIRMAERELAEYRAKEVEAEVAVRNATRVQEDRKNALHRLGHSTAGIDGARAEERAQMAELKKAEDNWRRHQGASVSSVGAKAIEEAHQQFEAAKAHYEAAQEKVKQSERDLLKSDLQEERELGEAEAKYSSAQAALDTALQGVKKLEEKVTSTTDKREATIIKAPIGGKIIRVNVSVNSVVTPGSMNNEPTSLLTIADTHWMLVAAQVDESDISQIEPGRIANVHMDAFPEVKFVGAVARIAQTADKDSKSNVSTFKVLVHLMEPPDQIQRVRSGMTAHCEIVTVTKPHVLVIKIPAVQSRSASDKPGKPGGDGAGDADPGKVDPATKVRVVFVVADGRARMRPLKDGIMDESFVEVLEGVAEGEDVVVGPGRVLDRLHDGDRVRIEQNEP